MRDFLNLGSSSLVNSAININFNFQEILTHISRSEKALVLRVFLGVFVLIFSFQSLTKAEDIRDFEIEGISIGDSLLNFADEKKIISSISPKQYPKNNFIIYEADMFIQVKKYDYLGVTTSKNDKNYIVTSISGMINYQDLEECLKLKKDIQNAVENIITYDEKEEVKYPIDKNDGTIHGIQYYLKPYPSMEAIVINCYHFTNESGRARNLSVSANSEKFAQFLTNDAYN